MFIRSTDGRVTYKEAVPRVSPGLNAATTNAESRGRADQHQVAPALISSAWTPLSRGPVRRLAGHWLPFHIIIRIVIPRLSIEVRSNKVVMPESGERK